MSELQDRVRNAKIFTTIDPKNGYHRITIKQGNEWKTAFRYRYGLYELLVIPFEHTNAHPTFQDMMNHILKDMLDEGVTAYIDDILIYAESQEQHDQIVEEVLKRLADNELVISLEKCVWRSPKVEFLGYIISTDGIEMAKYKTEAIQNWQTPASQRDVRSFLGFANFYRRFIKGF